MRMVRVSREEYLSSLQEEIVDHGLRGSIKQRLEAMDKICILLPYEAHREIQEYCSEIYDLLSAFSGVVGQRIKSPY